MNEIATQKKTELLFYTIADLTELLQLCEESIMKLIESGALPPPFPCMEHGVRVYRWHRKAFHAHLDKVSGLASNDNTPDEEPLWRQRAKERFDARKAASRSRR